MTDQATSPDELVTEASPPIAAIDTPNPDPAAKLDPAKQPTQPAAKTARVRKARPKANAKKRVAARDKAATAKHHKSLAQAVAAETGAQADAFSSEEARAAYAAATAHQVPHYADLPEGAAKHLRFANGSEFVTEGVDVPRDHLSVDGGRATYARAADFSPEGAPIKVSEAWLIAESGEAVRCEVGSGLAAGGGHHALIPSGFLIF